MNQEIDSKKIALAKVEKALRLIEEAQEKLFAACSELGQVVHANGQYDLISDKADEVKALWHKVNESIPRHEVDLDSGAKAKL